MQHWHTQALRRAKEQVRWRKKKNESTVKRFRVGQIGCAIWKNDAVVQGKNISLLKVTVERRYKDRNGDWKSSSSFGRNEILLAIQCLQKAFDAVVELEQQESKESQ